MVIVQAHNSDDWTPIKDAFESQGFSFVQHHSTLASVTYRKITTQILRSATMMHGVWYNVLRLNPNKKWMKATFEPKQIRYDIEFSKLLTELGFAANAKEKLESNIKAIKFKMDLYKIFLKDYFKHPLTNIRVKVESHQVDIHVDFCNNPISIKLACKSNSDKTALIENDMETYLGNIHAGSKVLKYVNIHDTLNGMNEHIFPVMVERYYQIVKYREDTQILTTKFQQESSDLRERFNKEVLNLSKKYTIVNDVDFTKLLEEGMTKCQK